MGFHTSRFGLMIPLNTFSYLNISFDSKPQSNEKGKTFPFIKTIGCHTSHVETLLHNVCTNLRRSQRQSPTTCLSRLAKCATLCHHRLKV